jgi:hypothetical protein
LPVIRVILGLLCIAFAIGLLVFCAQEWSKR